MTVRIQPNIYKRRLIEDLSTLVPPREIAIDTFGTVNVQNPTTRAGQLLYELVRSPVRVLLVGDEGAARFILDGQTVELRGVGGVTQANANPATDIVVGYDVTQCYGRGYQVRGANGELIPFPSHILLVHELAHAVQITSGQFTTREAGELFAVTEENVQRQRFSLLPRDTSSPATMADGGCAAAPKKETPTPTGDGCFVATAAFGSSLHPSVLELRRFREEVLRSSRYGRDFWERFYSVYADVSGPVVAAMADPEVRDLTRWAIVTPLVHYLRIARTFPDAEPETAGGEWEPFLTDVRSMLRDFASAVPLPSDLASVPATEAAADLAVALRFLLRDDASRNAWLTELVERSELPLQGDPGELAQARQVLRMAGRPDTEIARMVPAEVAGPTTGRRPPPLTGFGQVHVSTSTPDDRSRWIYTVTLRNSTTDTYQNVRAFYLVRPGNPDNMGVTIVPVINPGDVVVFPLGICSDIVSYYLEGEFVEQGGASGTFSWPSEGAITPARASAENPTDVFPCEDSWEFAF